MSITTLPKRAEVPDELTWDLSSVYTDEALWEADFRTVAERIPQLSAFKGKLGDSAETLLNFFKLRDQIGALAEKLWTYAHLRADEDTKLSATQALKERARTLFTDIGAALAFVEPEILTIDPERLEVFLSESSELAAHRHSLNNLLRNRPHVRSAEVEEVLAQGSKLYTASGQTYDMLSDADMVFPVIADGNGAKVRLSHGNFTEGFLHSPNRRARRRAYQAMFDTYAGYRNTIASTYAGLVNADMFQARVRGFDSTRQMKLFATNVDVAVYDTLIDTVNANIPRLTRYLRLRKKLLKLKELHWYDLYVPMVGEVDYKIDYRQAQQTVLAALAPLGREYVDALADGFARRWVDVVESQNKASGAYSSGSFLTPPFMLLNWQDSLESTFTLAHEAGHSMHSFFSRRGQPYHLADYTIFVAEVASTCNEALLAHYLLASKEC